MLKYIEQFKFLEPVTLMVSHGLVAVPSFSPCSCTSGQIKPLQPGNTLLSQAFYAVALYYCAY